MSGGHARKGRQEKSGKTIHNCCYVEKTSKAKKKKNEIKEIIHKALPSLRSGAERGSNPRIHCYEAVEFMCATTTRDTFVFMHVQKSRNNRHNHNQHVPFALKRPTLRVKMELLKYSENGNDDSYSFSFYLFVCRHSALPPRTDLCISRTSLSLAWRWVNKWKTTQKKRMATQTGKVKLWMTETRKS